MSTVLLELVELVGITLRECKRAPDRIQVNLQKLGVQTRSLKLTYFPTERYRLFYRWRAGKCNQEVCPHPSFHDPLYPSETFDLGF